MSNLVIQTTYRFRRWKWLPSAIIAAHLFSPTPAFAGLPNPPNPQIRTLVFIVPGTYGNDAFWPNVIPGKATFGSELQRALRPGDEVDPFLWYGANRNKSREAAADDLAAAIDEKAANFDRICLVGHSHGGNIALLAAGKCHAKIDMVVCLSTPHFYLPVKSANGTGNLLKVPVYCTWESRQNVKEIVNVFDDNDEVTDIWAELVKGLPPESAVSLTRSWREHTGFPRLVHDSIIAHAMTGLEILGSVRLNIANANLVIKSFVLNKLTGLGRHSAIHSRRMGYIIGGLVRDGFNPIHRDYLESLVQPKVADDGGPIAVEDQQAWLQAHDADFQWSGWRLAKITVQLLPSSKLIAKNLDHSDPSPCLEVCSGSAAKTPLFESLPAIRTYQASWTPGFVLLKDQTDKFVVGAWHVLPIPTSLGSRIISATTAEQKPPESFPADPYHNIYWSADLKWVPVHY